MQILTKQQSNIIKVDMYYEYILYFTSTLLCFALLCVVLFYVGMYKYPSPFQLLYEEPVYELLKSSFGPLPLLILVFIYFLFFLCIEE